MTPDFIEIKNGDITLIINVAQICGITIDAENDTVAIQTAHREDFIVDKATWKKIYEAKIKGLIAWSGQAGL